MGEKPTDELAARMDYAGPTELSGQTALEVAFEWFDVADAPAREALHVVRSRALELPTGVREDLISQGFLTQSAA